MKHLLPLEILEADGASRLHITIVDNDGYLFTEIPLEFYTTALDNIERINHPANAQFKTKAEFLVTAANAHYLMLKALEICMDKIETEIDAWRYDHQDAQNEDDIADWLVTFAIAKAAFTQAKSLAARTEDQE